jgi:hypothetical protein
VSTDISSIHFQGASIVRVIEDVDRRRLTFEVSYPLTERDSDFRRGKLIFELCSRYLVEEGHIGGEPVIQRAEVVEVAPWGALIRIHTDRGVREVSCFSIAEERPFAERREVSCYCTTEDNPFAEPGAAHLNGGPATPPPIRSVTEGPPSVS